MSEAIVEEIIAELRRRADPVKAEAARRFFKEPIDALGFSAPQLREMAREFHPMVEGDMGLALEVAGELMASGDVDISSLGICLVERMRRRIEPGHFDVFDSWIDYLNNWANTDGLCCRLIAETIKKDPGLAERLLGWTASENRWRRRAAAVSLVPIARRGEMLCLVFEVAERLMTDGDEMVQKGVGWLLKEASKEHPDDVRRLLMEWRGEAPALILRYASEKLPKDKRVLKTR